MLYVSVFCSPKKTRNVYTQSCIIELENERSLKLGHSFFIIIKSFPTYTESSRSRVSEYR